jgi:hypothetical protein
LTNCLWVTRSMYRTVDDWRGCSIYMGILLC